MNKDKESLPIKKYDSLLKFSSVNIRYLHSFLINPNCFPDEDLVHVLLKTKEEELKKYQFTSKIPESHIGFSPTMKISLADGDPGGEKNLWFGSAFSSPDHDDKPMEVIFDDRKLSLKCYDYLIRIAENNAGIMSIGLEHAPDVSLYDISILLNLVRRTLSKEKNELNGVKEEPYISRKTLDEHLSRESFILSDKFDEIMKKLSSSLNKVAFVKADEKLWLDEEIRPTTWHSQNPFIFITCTLPYKKYQKYFIKKINRKKVAREIAYILHRFIGWDTPDSLEMDFQGDKDKGYLRNFNSSKHVFVNLNKSICMVIHPDDARCRENARTVISSLLDAMELLRMQWHFCVVMNALLDKEIQQMNRWDELKALNRMIELRKWFALSYEDPLIYRYDADSTTEINEHARRLFKIDKLRELLREKMNMLDRLYDDYLQSSEISKLRAIRERKEKILKGE